MPEPRALTRNASDPQQVKFAGRKEKARAARLEGAIRAVMGTPAGRVVMWELLRQAGLYRSSWDPSARIHFLEGRRAFGLELLAQITDTDEELYLVMERECRAWERAEEREIAAAQTPRADSVE